MKGKTIADLVRQKRREQMELKLPAGIKAQDHQGDLLIYGSSMTSELYEQIKQNAPPAIASRLIGWKATHNQGGTQ